MYLAAQQQPEPQQQPSQPQKRHVPPGYGGAVGDVMPNMNYKGNLPIPSNLNGQDGADNMSILNQEFTRNLGLVDNYASYPPVNKHNSNRSNNNFGNFQRQSHGDQTPLSSTPPSLASGYRAPSSSPIVFDNSFLNPSSLGLGSGLGAGADNNRGRSDLRAQKSDLTQMFYQQHRQEQQGGIAYNSAQSNTSIHGSSTLSSVSNTAWGGAGTPANVIENGNFYGGSSGSNAQQELLRMTQTTPEQSMNANKGINRAMSYSYPGRANGPRNPNYNDNHNGHSNGWPMQNNVNNNNGDASGIGSLNLKGSYNGNGVANIGNERGVNLASSYPQTNKVQQHQQNAAPYPSVSPVQSSRKPLLGSDGATLNFASPVTPVTRTHNAKSSSNVNNQNAFTPPRRNGRQQEAWGGGNNSNSVNVNNHQHQQSPRTPPGGRGNSRNSRTPGGWETQRGSRHNKGNYYNNHSKTERSDMFEFQTQRRGRNRRGNKYDDRRNGSSPGGSPGNFNYRGSNGHHDRRHGRNHMNSQRGGGIDRVERMERDRDEYNSSPNSSSGGSTVLDKFKMDKSGREWTIDEIKGHIAMFARDRRATRFLQHRIEVADKDEMQLIYSEGFALLSEVKKKPAKIFSRLL